MTVEIYEKKKDNMNTILKYLFANLILKGDIPTLKADDAVLLMGGAAKEGHLMAKISMGLLFADGIDVNYDCARAVGYFYEESLSHPFFMVFYISNPGQVLHCAIRAQAGTLHFFTHQVPWTFNHRWHQLLH